MKPSSKKILAQGILDRVWLDCNSACRPQPALNGNSPTACYDYALSLIGCQLTRPGAEWMKILAAAFLLSFLLYASIPATAQRKTSAAIPNQTELEKMNARFAPTPLRVDTSKLPPGDRQA